MMEYPFKDLLPLDQVLEREGYYNDWTHLDPEVFYSLTQISEYIKTKGYGVDVRLLIAQLAEHFSLKTSQINEIERLFKDVLKELSKDQDYYSLPEIVVARGGKATLGERLDETTAQLAHKANKGDSISVSQIDKNKGKFDQTYMSDEFLQQMAGNTPINTVVANQSITQEKIVNGAIESRHVEFIKPESVRLKTGEYVRAGFKDVSPNQPVYAISDNRRSLAVSVKPLTRYKVYKDRSDLFRIAGTKTLPTEQGQKLDYFIKDEFTTDQEESTETYFEFQTSVDDRYVVIYVSIDSREPQVFIEEISSVNIRDNITASNITVGKNKFNGEYVDGVVLGSFEEGGDPGSIGKAPAGRKGKSAIVKIKNNTDYSISKTASSRFRVAVSTVYPGIGSNVEILTPENDGIRTDPFSFNSGEYNYVIVGVSNDETGAVPELLQIEEGSFPTQLETYGYKFTPEPKPFGISDVKIKDGKVYVDDFGGDGKSDWDAIQDAFNFAEGNIVVFSSGKTYRTNKQLIADVSKVRGIEGNNAKIISDLDGVSALKYYGSLDTSGSTGPAYPPNEVVQESEMNGFINRLNVRSATPYLADGIEVGNSIGITIQNSKMYKLRNGLVTSGIARNFIYENNYIYNNAENGMLFDDVDLHQFQIIGGHISYNYNNIKFVDSDMANGQLIGVSLENNTGNANTGFTKSGSLITFESTGVIKKARMHLYEAFMITGCNIQDHNINNLGPLINMDMPANGISDIMIGNNLIGNSAADVPAVFIRGVNGANLNNNSIVGFPHVRFNTSIKIAGVNKLININNNHLAKPIDYSEATITKMKISDNLLEDFTMPDSNDGNIMIKDNI